MDMDFETRLVKLEVRMGNVEARLDAIEIELRAIRASIQKLIFWTGGMILGAWVTIMLAIIGFGFAILHKG